MDESQLHASRPYGGCALLCNISTSVSIIPCDDETNGRLHVCEAVVGIGKEPTRFLIINMYICSVIMTVE